MSSQTPDIISPDTAKTLDGLFRERVKRSPHKGAYRFFDKNENGWKDITWSRMAAQVARWQRAMEGEPLIPGDRVAIWLRNCPEWVMADQAALGLGLITVPLYLNDRPENVAYLLRDSRVKLLLVEDAEYWRQLLEFQQELGALARVVSLSSSNAERDNNDHRLKPLDEWLPLEGGFIKAIHSDPDDLATLVYTSGTTGHPKGVKLSHRNVLWNAHAGLQSVPVYMEDVFLSFLPLSHAFERTVGYYLPIMAGAMVAYSRSIPQIGEDLITVRPTIIISVPRIFERIHSKIKHSLEEGNALARALFHWAIQIGWERFLLDQKKRGWDPRFLFFPLLDFLVGRKVRGHLGGRLRLAISGGAALPAEVGKAFVSLGVAVLQGYGMTETSPIVAVNVLKDNDPSSVGLPLRDVKAKINENGELLVQGPGVMQGYWNNPEATGKMIDAEGWLHTGDKARIEKGHIYITGRIKEIIVLANGEKIPPSDLEMAIAEDPLVEQVLIVGEGKPYLSALVVLEKDQWARLAKKLGLDPDNDDSLTDRLAVAHVLESISNRLRPFPGYAKVRRVALLKKPWTVENGLLTPTLKTRRNRVLAHHREEFEGLYEGH
jgi:long-chain acyl-CoA synthetase